MRCYLCMCNVTFKMFLKCYNNVTIMLHKCGPFSADRGSRAFAATEAPFDPWSNAPATEDDGLYELESSSAEYGY